MVSYRNVISVNCMRNDDKWDCDIVRLLSDKPKEMEPNLLCYIRKTERENALSDVHLKDKPKECTIDDVGTERYLRCE